MFEQLSSEFFTYAWRAVREVYHSVLVTLNNLKDLIIKITCQIN